jgi:hypothetical protein
VLSYCAVFSHVLSACCAAISHCAVKPAGQATPFFHTVYSYCAFSRCAAFSHHALCSHKNKTEETGNITQAAKTTPHNKHNENQPLKPSIGILLHAERKGKCDGAREGCNSRLGLNRILYTVLHPCADRAVIKIKSSAGSRTKAGEC